MLVAVGRIPNSTEHSTIMKTRLVMKTYRIVTLAVFAFGAASALEAADAVQDRYGGGYTSERFYRADVDGDGYLTLQEAGALSTEVERKGGKRRFQNADTNGDGLLSLEEATTRKSGEMKRGPNAAKQRQDRHYNKERFDAADTDGDGYLTKAEAFGGKSRVDVKGKNRFDKADADGDGRLSLDEATSQRNRERSAF